MQSHAFCGLKGGTETEDMEYDELQVLQEIALATFPLKVKIGGVEARTDIRFCHKTGIYSILAPMVESEYGLRNFIETLKKLIPAAEYQQMQKSINLETITGYRNILEIADSPAFAELHNLTAARSDLSASMNQKPDDPEVMRVTKQIVKIAQERGKKTCVGGTITRFNFDAIVEDIGPDCINSRHLIVDLQKIPKGQGSEVAERMLEFEIELYDFLAAFKPEKALYYKNRIETNRERLGNKKVVYSIR
ncbi:MAG: aldolase [Spirochaetota bacterium]